MEAMSNNTHTTEALTDLPKERLIVMLAEAMQQIRDQGDEFRTLMGEEPCFILRGRDVLAPDTIRFWAGQMEMISGHSEKVADALHLADQIEAWQRTHARKIPT